MINVKTAVYTHVNGYIELHIENSKKSKKVILPSNISPTVNIIFFEFCGFRCVTQTVAANICINCNFFYKLLRF